MILNKIIQIIFTIYTFLYIMSLIFIIETFFNLGNINYDNIFLLMSFIILLVNFYSQFNTIIMTFLVFIICVSINHLSIITNTRLIYVCYINIILIPITYLLILICAILSYILKLEEY